MCILQHTREPDRDRAIFFKSQMLFRLFAARDGHAKNLSIFSDSEDRYRLTPLYDVISAHPVLVQRCVCDRAVGVDAGALHCKRRHYHRAKIQPRRWSNMARICGLPESTALSPIAEMAATTSAVIGQVAQGRSEDFPPKAADTVFAGVTV